MVVKKNRILDLKTPNRTQQTPNWIQVVHYNKFQIDPSVNALGLISSS